MINSGPSASKTLAPRRPEAPDMLERINGIEVSEEMLADGAHAVSEMTDAGRNDFDQRMIVLIDVLKRRHPQIKFGLAALAVDFRLRALVRLLEATFVCGCDIDLVTRRPNISAAALRAAAREKLTRNPVGLASFDITAFKMRLVH